MPFKPLAGELLGLGNLFAGHQLRDSLFKPLTLRIPTDRREIKPEPVNDNGTLYGIN